MEKTPIVPKEKVVKVPIDQNDQKVSHMHFTGIQPSTINMQENYLYEDIIRTQLIVHTTQNVYASLEFQFSCMQFLLMEYTLLYLTITCHQCRVYTW